MPILFWQESLYNKLIPVTRQPLQILVQTFVLFLLDFIVTLPKEEVNTTPVLTESVKYCMKSVMADCYNTSGSILSSELYIAVQSRADY